MSGFGMLHEHEGADPTDGLEDLGDLNVPEPTELEEKTIKLCRHLFEKAKKNRAKYDSKWLDYYQMFRGDQWKNKRPSYRHSEIINFIFMHIQSTVSQMFDARPRADFTAQNPNDLEFAKVLSDLYEADAQKGNWLAKDVEAVFDGHFFGIGFGSIKFDPDADYGLGRIIHDSEDPFEIYPDPEARDVNDEQYSAYLVHAQPRDVEKIKTEYANHPLVGAIKSDLADFTKQDDRSAPNVRPQYNRQTTAKLPAETFSGNDERFMSDNVMVFTYYMKPADVVEEAEEETGSDGAVTVRHITKKKYPKGRRVVMINNRVFEDEPLETDNMKFPFMRYVNYIDPRQFFGISEIEPLESPQRIFNKLVSFVLDVLTLTGNPIWLIPTTSGVKPGSFHNAPGMQVPYDGNQPPTRQEGAQLQPYVIQMIDRMENWFNTLGGNSEVSRGIAPPGVTAASAIENLQDAAGTRTKQKMRNLDAYLTQFGEQYVDYVLQYYTVPRIYRLTDKDGLEKYFRFHVEHDTDEYGEEVKTGVIKNFTKDPDTGRMVEDLDEKRYLIRGSFDVKVNTRTGLPFVKGEREQKLLQLFDRQIIDREEVLKGMEYPNHEAVLERMRELDEQQAMAQGGM